MQAATAAPTRGLVARRQLLFPKRALRFLSQHCRSAKRVQSKSATQPKRERENLAAKFEASGNERRTADRRARQCASAFTCCLRCACQSSRAPASAVCVGARVRSSIQRSLVNSAHQRNRNRLDWPLGRHVTAGGSWPSLRARFRPSGKCAASVAPPLWPEHEQREPSESIQRERPAGVRAKGESCTGRKRVAPLACFLAYPPVQPCAPKRHQTLKKGAPLCIDFLVVVLCQSLLESRVCACSIKRSAGSFIKC